MTVFTFLLEKKSAQPPSVLESLWGTVGDADGMILPGLLGASLRLRLTNKSIVFSSNTVIGPGWARDPS